MCATSPQRAKDNRRYLVGAGAAWLAVVRRIYNLSKLLRFLHGVIAEALASVPRGTYFGPRVERPRWRSPWARIIRFQKARWEASCPPARACRFSASTASAAVLDVAELVAGSGRISPVFTEI